MVFTKARPVTGFAFGPVLSRGRPKPPPPKNDLGYGDYCFRAACIYDYQGKHGVFMGYNTDVRITDAVGGACRVHASSAGGTCSEPELVMLKSSPLRCGGQITFVFDGKTKIIV